MVHHCSFCCPSATADTPPWPLFTSLKHAHSPSTDSFHSVTSKTEHEQLSALNISCFPFSCSYHSMGLVIACSYVRRVCELSVPHKIKFSLHFYPQVRSHNAVQAVSKGYGFPALLINQKKKRPHGSKGDSMAALC